MGNFGEKIRYATFRLGGKEGESPVGDDFTEFNEFSPNFSLNFSNPL